MGKLHVRVMRLVARTAEEIGNTSARLEGGTALAAYYLGHRESEDLDFFSDYGFDQRVFGEAVRKAGAAEGLRLDSTGTSNPTFARYIVRDENDPAVLPIKIDFAGQSPFRLAPLEETAEGIRIGSYRDIAANKLHAVCDRIEARDFIDLHVMLTHGELDPADREHIVRKRARELVADVMEIDPGMNPRVVGDGVARGFNRPILTGFPLRLFVPMNEEEVQQTLRMCASECAAMVAEEFSDES